MSNSEPNYWKYSILRQSVSGKPVLTAVYIGETHRKSLDEDLGSQHSHLRGFLETYFRIDPKQFAQQHQLNAQALLGGLIASQHCSLHFGIWVPVEPPPVQAIPPPASLGTASMAENGVRVWLVEEGNTAWRSNESLELTVTRRASASQVHQDMFVQTHDCGSCASLQHGSGNITASHR